MQNVQLDNVRHTKARCKSDSGKYFHANKVLRVKVVAFVVLLVKVFLLESSALQ
jgi:hypothetical protein